MSSPIPELAANVAETWSMQNILSAISLVVSFFAFWFGWRANTKANTTSEQSLEFQRHSAKADALLNIKRNIDAAKARVIDLGLMVIDSMNVPDDGTPAGNAALARRTAYYEAKEQVLNAYEDGCSKYYKDQINKDDFIEKYHQDIADQVNNNREKFDNITRFRNMLKYYHERHQNLPV